MLVCFNRNQLTLEDTELDNPFVDMVSAHDFLI